MKILYIAPFRDFSGYATASRGYLRALDQAGADLVARAIRYDQADPGSTYKVTDREQELLSRPLNNVDVIIQHTTPNECRLLPSVDGKTNIAVVAWETTRIPGYWAERLNKFDAVITFCAASERAFRDSGVTVPIYKVPHTFDIGGYDLTDVEPISSSSAPDFLSKRFVFYNISQFAAKKGIDALLRAYFGEFHGQQEDVVLMLKTYIGMVGRQNEQEKLRAYVDSVKQGMRLPPDGYPPVMIVTKTLSEKQMKKLHRTGDAYVCSSRGEGWCIPAFDALAYGNKLITTLWGGMGEFAMTSEYPNGHSTVKEEYARDNVYPVAYSLEPLVGQQHNDPELYTSFDKVAEPSVSSLMAMMRQAYVDRDVDCDAPDLMEFDHSTVGPEMLQVIDAVVTSKQEPVNV